MDLKKIFSLVITTMLTLILISITYWLLSNSIKYVFIILELLLIASIYILIQGTEFTVKVKPPLNFFQHTDTIIISIMFFLYILTITKTFILLELIYSILISFFFSGYVLLRIINFHPSSSKLEWVVLSFWFSIPINCIIYSIVVSLMSKQQIFVISTQFFFFTFILLINKYKQKQHIYNKYEFDIEINKIFPLIIVTLIFITFIVINYPDMALRPGLDIISLFTSSQRILTEQPINSNYPWFHIQLLSIYIFNRAPPELLQTCLTFLNIMVFLTFYVMANEYLKNINVKLPTLSTVFWGLFSGFGWLHFFEHKLEKGYLDQIKLLDFSRTITYWDIGYGQGPWIWLWFRPLTLGMIGFFILIYFLKRNDLKRPSYIFLIFITTITLSLLHFSELVFFTGLLLLLGFFYNDGKIRLMDCSISVLIGIVTIPGISFLYEKINVNFNISSSYIYLLAIIAAFNLLLLLYKKHFYRNHPINISLDFLKPHGFIFLSVIWLSTLIYWFMNAENFKVSLVYPVYGVPWLFYPILLGVCGLLAIPGSYYFAKKFYQHPASIFIIIFIYGIIFGRLLTYIKINYIDLVYWERRIIPLTFSASALIASIPTLYIFKRMKSKPFLFIIVLSIFVFSGLTSTFLTIEHQMIQTQNNRLTENELKEIEILEHINTNSYILTSSTRSNSVSHFILFTRNLTPLSYHILSSIYPEFALNVLFSTGHSTIIYLTQNDLKQLRSQYSEGYVIQHLKNTATEYSENNNSQILKIQDLAPPIKSSDCVLILPENITDHYYLYAYNTLSSLKINYTTACTEDILTIRDAQTLIAPSEKIAIQILKMRERLELSFTKLLIINLDGYYDKFHDHIFNNTNSNILSHVIENDITIYYLNAYPIIEASSNMKHTLDQIANMTKPALDCASNYVFKSIDLDVEPIIAFEKGIFNGNITISFDSIVITNNKSPIKVIVDEIEYSISPNSSYISIINFNQTKLNANSLTLQNGKGYYLNTVVNNTYISFKGKNTSCITFEGSDFNIIKGNEIKIIIENSELYLRNPKISVVGTGEFKDLYAYHYQNELTGILGDDVIIEGDFRFEGIYGDKYTICNDFNLDGKIKSSKQLYTFKEFQYFIDSIPYITSTLIITFILIYIIKKKVRI